MQIKILTYGRKFANSFYRAIFSLIKNDGVEHSGYLAFLALLSIFPILVFFVAIAGMLGQLDFGRAFIHQLTNILPSNFLGVLLPRIKEITDSPPQHLISFSIIGIIWTASSILEGMRTTLNRAYRVNTPPAYIFRRLLSVAQIIMFMALCVVAMFILVALPIIKNFMLKHGGGVALHFIDFFVEHRYLIGISLLFFVAATTFFILPNVRQSLIDVVPGAILVVAGWLLVSEIFSFYISLNTFNSIYGSLAGIIVALLFFYLDFIILIFGAEFNYFFEKSLGINLPEKEHL